MSSTDTNQASEDIVDSILSMLGIVDRTSGNRPEQIATLEQELTAHINAEIAKVLDRLEKKAGWYSQQFTEKARHDPSTEDTLVPLSTIQAERAKLKERDDE